MTSTKVPVTKDGRASGQAGEVEHPHNDGGPPGKAERKLVPLSVDGEWKAGSDRPDPDGLLQEQGERRVPKLVGYCCGGILVSPFTFCRGAAHLMTSDLASARPEPAFRYNVRGRARVQLRVFAAQERRLVLSVNDFDETLPVE